MKKYPLLIIVLLIAAALLMQCAKVIPSETVKARLFITLKNDSGKTVSGATVRLYKNAADSGIKLQSDSSGTVLFTNLEDSLYYWLASKACSTNLTSQTSLNRVLATNAVIYGYSVMAETGALKIINNSTEPYKIFDSTATFTVVKDTPYLAYRRVKLYKVHIEKVSTPGVGRDTSIRIRCSDTTVINLP